MQHDKRRFVPQVDFITTPGFLTGVGAREKAGLPRGTDSFSIQVPRTQEGDQPYTITIDPEGGGDMPPSYGSTAPAELVPPHRLTLAAPFDVDRLNVTGAPARVLENVEVDSTGAPLAGVSSAGSLAYVARPINVSRLVWVSRQGVERPVTDASRR